MLQHLPTHHQVETILKACTARYDIRLPRLIVRSLRSLSQLNSRAVKRGIMFDPRTPMWGQRRVATCTDIQHRTAWRKLLRYQVIKGTPPPFIPRWKKDRFPHATPGLTHQASLQRGSSV